MTEEGETPLETIRLLEEEDRVNAQAVWLASLDGRVESFSEGWRQLLEGYQSGDIPDWATDMPFYIDEARTISSYQKSIQEAADDETWSMAQDLYLLVETTNYLLEEENYREAGRLLESFREKYGSQ